MDYKIASKVLEFMKKKKEVKKSSLIYSLQTTALVVSRPLKLLCEKKLITKMDDEETFVFNPQSAFVIAVDVADDYMTSSLFDLDCNSYHYEKLALSPEMREEDLCVAVIKAADKIRKLARGMSIVGLCVAFDAEITGEDMLVTSSARHFSCVDFVTPIKQALSMPVTIVHRLESALIAEAANRNMTSSNVAFVDWSRNITASFINNGRIVSSDLKIDRMILGFDEERSVYLTGENTFSGKALAEQNNFEYNFSTLSGNLGLSKSLINCAELFSQLLLNFALACGADKIIIAGDLTGIFPDAFTHLENCFDDKVRKIGANIKLMESIYSSKSAIMGAGAYALRHFVFDDPSAMVI